MKVPEVLLNGHHKLINEWRKKKQIEKTIKIKPKLFKKGENNEK
jgi:tRNA (guanine37-N1)-methyltransferase